MPGREAGGNKYDRSNYHMSWWMCCFSPSHSNRAEIPMKEGEEKVEGL